MKTKNDTTLESSPSKQIDAIIKNSTDWRGKKLSALRAIVNHTSTDIVEEVKWKKPSKPEGVAVWSCNGILCVADVLKSAVRLTFFKGALLKDPKKLFNTRLDSKTVRAIDFFEDDVINDAALKAIILEAIKINTTARAT